MRLARNSLAAVTPCARRRIEMTNRSFLIAVLIAVAIAPDAAAATIDGIYLSVSTAVNGSSANYASGPGVSPYSAGGLSSDLNGGVLSTTPNPMPLGLTSGTLSIANSADPATGLATATLGTGSLHAVAHTNGTVVGCGGTCTSTQLASNSEASFVDTLTFSVSGGGQANITVNVHVAGQTAFSAANSASYQFNTKLELGVGGDGYFTQAGYSYGPSFSVLTNPGAPFQFGTFTNESDLGYDFTGTISVTDGESLFVSMDLNVLSNNGVNVDFNGTLSLVLPSNVTFTSASGVFPGTTTSVPRDFEGNSLSGELLYDPSNGQSYTALSNGDGTYQYIPNLFTSGFNILRTGDYNGDGKADLIVYNSQTALAYIGFGNGDGTFDFQSLFWSPGYDTVTTGDINGDGKTDVLLYNSTTGTLYTGISNGDATFTYLYHLVSQGFTFVALAAFEGNRTADLMLYNSNNGLAFLGVGDGTGNFTFNPLSISPGYNEGTVGDLNGDGKGDFILYDETSGSAATAISNGSGGFTFTPLVFSPGFTAVRLGDYTGDGKASVTVYNKNNGAAYFGTGNGDGTFTFQSLFWSPGYNYVLIGDVDADGKPDVILYNSATGTEYTGLSNGNGTFSYTYSYWGLGKLLAP
jgi:hypothetical protein